MDLSARQTLEERLTECPDDLTAHAAYADLLCAQGDSRGEFIRIQLALENASAMDAPQLDHLRPRQKDLLQDHGRTWFCNLAPFLFRSSKESDPEHDLSKCEASDLPESEEFSLVLPDRDDRPSCDATYRQGWLSTLSVDVLTRPLAQALARAPEARLLKELFIGWVKWEGSSGPLVELARSPYLGNVRVLKLDAIPESENEYAQFGADAFDVVELIKTLRRVESLDLQVSYLDASKLFGISTLGQLRSLCLTNVYHEITLDALVANPQLAQLRELRLRSLRPERTSAFPDADQALAYLNRLSHLRHLEFHSREDSLRADVGANALCAAIARSGILRQIRVLVLNVDAITDEGARALAASSDLCRLERVVVRSDRLTESGRKILLACGAHLETRP